jgi:hypothetical protein
VGADVNPSLSVSIISKLVLTKVMPLGTVEKQVKITIKHDAPTLILTQSF